MQLFGVVFSTFCGPKFFNISCSFILCNFSVQTLQYFLKKNLKKFLPTKSSKNHLKKLLTYGSWEFYFSAAPTAQNSPELYFRFINSFIQPSLVGSLLQNQTCSNWIWIELLKLFWAPYIFWSIEESIFFHLIRTLTSRIQWMSHVALKIWLSKTEVILMNVMKATIWSNYLWSWIRKSGISKGIFLFFNTHNH